LQLQRQQQGKLLQQQGRRRSTGQEVVEAEVLLVVL
jgi:hypothetical protein